MRTFEIFLNKKKVCTAGVGDDGVLTAIVNWVLLNPSPTEGNRSRGKKEELSLQIGGLANAEHISWRNRLLRVGDEVVIKIGESDKATEPRQRKKSDPARDLRAKQNYVMNAAKEFGWTILKKQ